MPCMTFIDPKRGPREVEAEDGATILDIARRHGIRIEGACDGMMACATCQVIFAGDDFARLPAPSKAEINMLSISTDATPTTRLGCQIVLTEAFDGLTVRIPG